MLAVIFNVIRGAFVGLVELIPGVSGGTVALIVGIYDDLIGGASHVVRGVLRAVIDPLRGRGLGAAREHFRSVRWAVILPVGVGMVLAVFGLASVITVLLENYPRECLAVFFGLIAASIAVPVRMTGKRWGSGLVVLALAAAALSFFLTGLPPAAPQSPAPWLIFISAAFAICALVLPGVSGSFILLTIGMYQPTINAVATRDIGYLAIFLAGAVVGLSLFVGVLSWLLTKHRVVTLTVMAGLMLGSLRALWPWSDADGGLAAPGADWPMLLALALVAAAIVVVLIVIEARRLRAAELETALSDAEGHSE